MEIGYALSSEEHEPLELVRNAVRAEEAGFGYALVSDHYHPWIDRQGHSPFVWSVVGGIAASTSSIRLGTGVTCPLIRIHPAIVAQAAATSAALMPGRFFLGVGTGENLNEHVLGDRWPSTRERREMLEEAIDVMRVLWKESSAASRASTSGSRTHASYTLPDEPIPVIVAAAASRRRSRGRAEGRRPRLDRARARDCRRLPRRGRQRADVRDADRVGRRTRTMARDGARVVAQRGPQGDTRTGAAAAESLRAGS